MNAAQWCLDGWYSDSFDAEGMRQFYLANGATNALIVPYPNTDEGNFAIAYFGEPVAKWHATAWPPQGRP